MDGRAALGAADGLALSLPRRPQRGASGDRRSASIGASVEIHDWRAYQPGDDVRTVDWNAAARTGDLIVRLREDEIAPRVEIVLDASRSMAAYPEKSLRARELAALFSELASRQGLAPVLLVLGQRPRRVEGAGCLRAALDASFDAADDLGSALRRSPPLRRCGLRLVVSDFLFDASLDALTSVLSRDAAALGLVQVLSPEDTDPPGGFGARLVDSESGEALEHLLTPELNDAYRARLEQHQVLLRRAAHRVRAVLRSLSAAQDLASLVRGPLFPIVAPEQAQVGWP